MNHKVLLADDSLTIQKVIKITLANQPYEITDCSTEEELFHSLMSVQPKIVFLDFNLSEKYTGFELTTKIKSLLPSTKVLLLLGTFDTVDEVAMEKCGASDKIVKPFDSNKFIAICKQLIDTFVDEDDLAFPEEKVESEEISSDPDDQWTMSHSTEQNFPDVIETKSEKSLPKIENPLMKEMSDWGMSVPGVIDEDPQSDMPDLPPVMAKVSSIDEHREAKAPPASKYEVKFPENDDLDYPTMEELTATSAVTEQAEPKSKLISIDSFNNRAEDLELEGSYVANDADVSSIEDQIRDEVEEDLWVADEFEDLKNEVSSKIEEVKNGFQPSRNDFDDSLFKPLDENESIDWDEHIETLEPIEDAPVAASTVSFDKNEMEEMVKRYVKEYMDELFQKSTEKVAWEVIPDLAENLIRQELSKIANKVMEE